mmetsp:Transcript_28968/g.56663  ORF Transcript_28968/g.56663 Transcript_28968/m.56663 type:complete len:104 (-) Transcript_28968:162-473(-)
MLSSFAARRFCTSLCIKMLHVMPTKAVIRTSMAMPCKSAPFPLPSSFRCNYFLVCHCIEEFLCALTQVHDLFMVRAKAPRLVDSKGGFSKDHVRIVNGEPVRH